MLNVDADRSVHRSAYLQLSLTCKNKIPRVVALFIRESSVYLTHPHLPNRGVAHKRAKAEIQDLGVGDSADTLLKFETC